MSKILFINLLILLVFLIIIELSFRLLGFGYGNAPLENDHYLHHVHPKDYEYKCYVPTGEYGGHIVKYDQFRRRVNEKKSDGAKNKEIWFMGDSFTEAIQVSWDNSFAGIIDNSTAFCSINFGVSSYSPLIYFIQLNNELSTKSNKPEMVFIQLFSNDVGDDDNYSKYTKFDSADKPIKCDGGQPEILTNFFRKIYLARVSKRAVLTIRYVLRREKSLSKNIEKKINNYIEEAPIIEGTRFAKSITQIHNFLNGLKIKHYFFAIPSKYSCLSGDWSTPTFSSNFIHFMNENNFPYINLDNSFRKTQYPARLFYKEDIHCNEEGNYVIAREIISLITNNAN